MRPHPRRASTDPSSPQAWGSSDRNGMVGNHQNLKWQMEWRGTKLQRTGILVWDDEYDEPQRQLGTIVLPPDPMPIRNARPEQYLIDEQPVSTRVTADGSIRVIAGVPQGTGAAWVIERIVAIPGNI